LLLLSGDAREIASIKFQDDDGPRCAESQANFAYQRWQLPYAFECEALDVAADPGTQVMHKLWQSHFGRPNFAAGSKISLGMTHYTVWEFRFPAKPLFRSCCGAAGEDGDESAPI